MIGRIDGDKLVKELIDLSKEYHQLSNDLILRDGGSHEFENDVCVTSGNRKR